ncbi:MAG: rRNA pseudouridine synthase [Clostridia bacterium]|nr:MAG: rRNA pseudouridine synthase [Clostridia bacterium]
MRLNKFLAGAGVASRRKVEALIAAGQVKVNGEVVREPGRRVDPERDVVLCGGRRVHPASDRVYLLLYKPRGYVTTTRDPQGRPKVTDLVPPGRRLYPVGRLDADTEGLLLMTDDGELAYLLTHPRYEVEKTYLALVKGGPGLQALQRLRQGVRLEDGITAPARVRIAGREGVDTWLEITIHEGRNRQVRRMSAAVGHPVLALKRTRIAFLDVGTLQPGSYRHLTQEEVTRLKALATAHQAGFS